MTSGKTPIHKWPQRSFIDPEKISTVKVYCPACRKQNELHNFECFASYEPALEKDRETHVMRSVMALTVTLYCPECKSVVSIYGLTE